MMWAAPLYLGAVLHIAGLPYPLIFKLLILLPNLLGGVGLYLWLKSKYGFIPSVVASIVFIWVPYRFLDSFIRYSIGELFFLAFLPFVFYFIDHAEKLRNVILGGIFSALMIYSHQGLSLVAYIIFIVYSFIETWPQKKLLTRKLILLANGLLLTLFYWLPLLLYTKILHLKPDPIDTRWFPPLSSLVRSKWEGGFVDGQYLIMSFQIGLAHLLILFILNIFVLYRLISHKKVPSFILALLVLFWLSIFFLQPISTPVWDNIPLLAHLQFPFRFLIFPMIVSSTATAFLLSQLKKKTLYIVAICLIIVVVVENRNHLGVANKDVNIRDIETYEETYFVGNDMFPFRSVMKDIEKNKDFKRDEFTIISGKGKVITAKREDYQSSATINMDKRGIVQIRRFYFPGWEIIVGNKRIESNNNFILEVVLDKGKHLLKVMYKDPLFVQIATLISVVTFFVNSLLIGKHIIYKTSNKI